MKKDYKIIQTPFGGEIIQYEENGVLYSIPMDEANSDYQAYLATLVSESSIPQAGE
jgi:hypothetical protein